MNTILVVLKRHDFAYAFAEKEMKNCEKLKEAYLFQ